ncbi:MAG: YegP family protein [Salinimicrobium sediminis]|nr:YegP family protein [Salinimicrobium sediminis]
MRAEFLVFVGADQQFYFHLQGNNNEIILKGSESYSSRQAALEGIESVRQNSKVDEHFQRFINKANEPQFRLVARNGEIIGVSESYSSKDNLEKGIEAVKGNAPSAPINDSSTNTKRQDVVAISIKGESYDIHRGSNSVSDIKKLGKIPVGHNLVLIEGNKMTVLNDSSKLTIKGGEVFDSTPKSGADS